MGLERLLRVLGFTVGLIEVAVRAMVGVFERHFAKRYLGMAVKKTCHNCMSLCCLHLNSTNQAVYIGVCSYPFRI